jgi:hypothetical protein
MNNREKLSQIFSDGAFLAANKDKDNLEDIFQAVIAVDPSITKEELQEFLTDVSYKLNAIDSGELSESDLAEVAGGGGITFFAVVSALGGCYKLGEGLGKFVYHLTH